MNELLSMASDRRQQVFEQAAARMNLAAVGMEKDFWVCWILDKLFRLSSGQHLTFKGGTSLSKAWQLIERFSEDVDITIHRDALGFDGENAPHAAPTKTQRRKRLDKLRTACEEYIANKLSAELGMAISVDLPDRSTWSLDPDPEDSQSLLFKFPSEFSNQAEYLRPWAKIEMGSRADVEPAEIVTIRPYVAEVFPDIFQKAEIKVRSILPVRTFWEKAMLLHEETFRPEGKSRKAGMARHYYDLYQMIKAGIGDKAAADMVLFEQIADHRENYFEYNWINYDTYQPGRLQIVPLEKQLPYWQTDYSNMQGEMFFGEAPDFEEILEQVQKFQDKFNLLEEQPGNTTQTSDLPSL